jgi:hypothetical protein
LDLRGKKWKEAGEDCIMRSFGPKRKEVEGDWRRLHNEELWT